MTVAMENEDKLSALSMEKKITPAVAEAPQEGGQDPKRTNEEHQETAMTARPNIRFPSCQLIFVVMGFCGFIMVYSLRVNMSVALVAMVNVTYLRKVAVSKDEACIDVASNHTREPSKFPGTFKFDGEEQSQILSTFFIGYVFLQIPGGTVAQKVGGKLIFIGCMFFTSVFTLLTPVLADGVGYWGLIAARALQGLSQGASFPSMHVLMSKWTTLQERNTIVTFIYAGNKLGIVLTNAMAGLVCETIGWKYVFYITGSLGLLWSLLSTFLIYASPREHPRISPQECQYIEMSQGEPPTKGSLKVPWLEILKSPPVYALCIAHFVYGWSNFTLLQTIPQYLRFILDYNIYEDGFLSGLPYLVMWASMILTGLACDYLKSHNVMSVTNIRKFMMSFSFIGAAAFLVGTGYVVCNRGLAVTLLTLSVGFTGVSWGGWSVNQLDLAPPYAGTLMGISNGLSTIAGIIGPRVVGAFTKRELTRASWRKFFFLTAGLNVFASIVYSLFGSGERQKWGHVAATDVPMTNKETDKAQESKEEPT